MTGVESGPATEEVLPKSAPFIAFEEAFLVRLRNAAEALEEVARLLLGEANQLNFTEMRILAYLRDKGSASGGQISRSLRVDNAWISRLLQGLSGKGLIVQTRDPSDQRVVLASLTDAGRTVYEKSLSDVGRCNGSIMEGLDEDLATEMIVRLESNLRTVALRLRSHDSTIFDY